MKPVSTLNSAIPAKNTPMTRPSFVTGAVAVADRRDGHQCPPDRVARAGDVRALRSALGEVDRRARDLGHDDHEEQRQERRQRPRRPEFGDEVSGRLESIRLQDPQHSHDAKDPENRKHRDEVGHP